MFDSYLQVLSGLVGFSALLAVLINAAKSVGLVKDGQAKNYSVVANLVVLVLLVANDVFGLGVNLGEVDGFMAQAGVVAEKVFELFLMLGGSKLVHNVVKGVPVLGKSHSL